MRARLAWMKEWRSKLSWSTNYRSGCVYGFRHPANNFCEADTRVLVTVGILAIIKSASMRKQTCACAAALRVFSDQPHAVKAADSRVEDSGQFAVQSCVLGGDPAFGKATGGSFAQRQGRGNGMLAEQHVAATAVGRMLVSHRRKQHTGADADRRRAVCLRFQCSAMPTSICCAVNAAARGVASMGFLSAALIPYIGSL